ncbi:MAG: ABC transporter permease subunit [Cyanobacteriota bacterium]|nr:ABC transporter permease subunit [Cyanobacteriota bacterium]
MATPSIAPGPTPWWRHRQLMAWLVQGITGLVILVLVAFLTGNLVRNLTNAGLLLSWSWLDNPAGFDISETWLPFDAGLPYWRALLAGLVNTLRVVVLGLVGSTVLGTLVGIAAFSRNGLLRGLARAYVELIRNIPLLLQLVFWYFVVFLALPGGREAIQLPGLVLAKSGLYLGTPELINGVWQGQLRFTVEFSALLTGLVVYTAAFIAEVVRGGVASVPAGQWEAARSLGFTPLQTLQRIVLPQAMRVIIPSLNSQYISLAKNSSLAVACGYSDLYSVAETTLNQTGRAVEVVLILLGAYLVIDLVISTLMNGVNRLVQIKER